ncbi:helix-turn-helix domain-containing protein [Natrinema halophilum]|uniref:Helix-turn-helix domain-containing protein n=1 Tax=Natrinema halophilum TaxID=1699371 RepID=A0A7D5GRQ8_9EURY|nr:helix-turn-helix domain-containing protein [Natrinema halophilum]QLG48689.1 helix-turn-helix domain-containing protein [Natrinema halophilum]
MLIATFQLDLDAVALEQAFDAVPEMTVEAERIAAHSTQWTMPCLWIAADDFKAVDNALENDPSVDETIGSDEYGDVKYYHINWNEETYERLSSYIDKEGSILRADATDDRWELEIRFVSRDQFDEFRTILQKRGHTFKLLNLYEPGAPRQTEGKVTPAQRNDLVTAAELGYYTVPRDISTRELADELDISHQSVSELLHRGTENLITSHLMTTTVEA